MSKPQRYYGLLRDKKDERDYKRTFAASEIPSASQPTVDLREYVLKVYGQGELNSCTANAVCAAYGIDLVKQSKQLKGEGYYYFPPSRLFLYYNTRVDKNHDRGASLRDTLKASNKIGVCPESADDKNSWQYDISNVFEKPPPKCYSAAEGNTTCKYHCLEIELDQFRACLKGGYPFVFGFNVFSNFDDIDQSGVMPMPPPGETSGHWHAVVAVGYDDKAKCIIVLNSWGDSFGDKGYFYMPYDFVTNSELCGDFWKIEFACERRPPPPTYTELIQQLPSEEESEQILQEALGKALESIQPRADIAAQNPTPVTKDQQPPMPKEQHHEPTVELKPKPQSTPPDQAVEDLPPSNQAQDIQLLPPSSESLGTPPGKNKKQKKDRFLKTDKPASKHHKQRKRKSGKVQETSTVRSQHCTIL